MIRRTAMLALTLAFAGLYLLGGASCKKQSVGVNPAVKKDVDLSNWKANPKLPKPEISATVEIVKEHERKKISMKVTATEANGLTVHEVQFSLKYRVFDSEKKKYDYPKGKFVYKMIPKLEKGHQVWTTPIVETQLLQLAWDGEDDNWEIEIRSYNQYYKE